MRVRELEAERESRVYVLEREREREVKLSHDLLSQANQETKDA